MLDLTDTPPKTTAYPTVVSTADEVVYRGSHGAPPEFGDEILWSAWHDRTAITARAPRMTVVRCTGDNLGDFVSISAQGLRRSPSWMVAACEATRVHDDFIENDTMQSGTIVDCLADGCSMFVSTRYGSTNAPPDGTDATVVISRTLARISPFYNSFKPTKYGYGQAGGLFKVPTNPLEGVAPRFVLSRCTFAAQQRNRWGNLGPPERCTAEDVTLIWTGPTGTSWPADDVRAWQACTERLTLLDGEPEWAARAEQWRALHR